jgi:hypothetical protein
MTVDPDRPILQGVAELIDIDDVRSRSRIVPFG